MVDVRTAPGTLAQEYLSLWEGEVPAASGAGLLDQPIISVHLPDPRLANGCGVVVCPGGGYRVLASDHEGLQVASWLNRQGIAAFVLRYRVAPTYPTSVSLLDGQRALRLVRSRADEFAISSNRLGMLGFSAGGHLCCNAGTSWDIGDPENPDPVEQMSCRPDFIVPVYAVTNGEKRGRKADEYTPTDAAVTADSAPGFIVSTHEDTIVPASQSTLFYDALLAHGVKAELHIFNDGEHGLGLMAGDPDVAEWTLLLKRWLRRRGFLTSAPRVAVAGRITLAGAAMGMCWITLLPQDETAPLARVRINRASDGHFAIEAADGPVPGKHRLQVIHMSEAYPHTASGLYTMAEPRVFETEMEIEPGCRIELDLTDDDFAAVS